MQIQNWNPVGNDDLKGAQPWAEGAFAKVNSQIEALTLTLQGNASVAENLFAEVVTAFLAHEEPTTLELQRIAAPIGVIHLGNELFDFAMVVMRRSGEKEVEVKASFVSAPESAVETTLLFIGG